MTPVRRWKVPVLAGAAFLLASCSNDDPQNSFDSQGKYASDINDLNWIYIAAGVVGVIVAVMTVIALVKFRERPGAPVPRQLHGHTKLEIAWTIAPAVILAVVALPTIGTIMRLSDKPDRCLSVNVVGQQWWWEFSYDNGAVTANEMVIPAGEEVCLSMTSRDVIHSFWVPKLNGKRDVVPGRVHEWFIQADEPGDYWGQCAEYCGLSHANMRLRVRALPAEQFDRWLENEGKDAVRPEGEMALAGEAIFAQQCASCHVIRGAQDGEGQPVKYDQPVPLVAGAAPNLTHFAARSQFAGAVYSLYEDDPATPDVDESDPYNTPNPKLNRADLEAWLRDPPARVPQAPDQQRGMPNLGLSESQIDELVAYLSGLK